MFRNGSRIVIGPLVELKSDFAKAVNGRENQYGFGLKGRFSFGRQQHL